MNYTNAQESDMREAASQPSVLVVTPLLPSVNTLLKDGEFRAGSELRGKKAAALLVISVLACFLPYTIKLKAT